MTTKGLPLGIAEPVTEPGSTAPVHALNTERSGIGAWEWDLQSNEITVTENWASMAGYTLEEVATLDTPGWERLVHPDDLSLFRAARDKCRLSICPSFAIEYRLLHRTNRWLRIFDCGHRVDPGDSGQTPYIVGTCIDISVQSEVAQELAIHRQAISDHTIVSETDLSGTIRYANELFSEISGYSRDELIGQNHRLVRSGYHSKRFWRDMFATLARKGVWHGEVCNRRKDGTLYWVTATNVAMRDSSGKIKRYISIRTDITATKETQQRMQSIFSTMPDGVLLVNQDRQILECNEAAGRLLGSPNDIAIGSQLETCSWQASRADESHPSFNEHPVAITLRTGQSLRGIVYGINDSSGSQRWLALSTASIRDFSERIVAAVLTVTDITELRQHEARLALTIKSAELGTWDWNIRTNEFVINDFLWNMLGNSKKDLRLRMRDWHAILDPTERRQIGRKLKAHLAGGTKELRCELRVRRGNGDWIWLLACGRVTERGVDSRPTRAMGICIDITKSKLLQANLISARAAAEEASIAKTEFLANMSHEIRTPMTAILGYAELLHDASEQEQTDYLNMINVNGKHLMSLINDLLDLSKIEAGQMQIELIDVAPAQIVQNVISIMSVEAHNKNIELRVVLESAVPAMIRSDPVRLRQILFNIVGNAIKFTSHGSVTLSIGLEANSSVEPRLRFAITDTGIGMTRSQLQRLFQAFQQADAGTTRRFGGTGLGLHISKRLTEMLGGAVEVTSTYGQGSTFIVSVPTGPLDGVESIEHWCSVSATQSAHAIHRSALQNQSLAGARILLAEDNEANRRLIMHHLRHAGAELIAVDNGKRLVEALTSGHMVDAPLLEPAPFDLIVTDMQMPEMDGYAATRLLRAKGCVLPIVALTAHAMQADIARCRAAGCDAHAAKPISAQELLETCARFVTSPHDSTATDATAKRSHRAPLRASQRIVSSAFADDPTMTDLIRGYIEELPRQIMALEALLTQERFDGLAHLAHQLKGSGGGYGFNEITDAAHIVEKRAKVQTDLPSLRQAVDELIDTCQSACDSSPYSQTVVRSNPSAENTS